ncbi:alpha/beta hydrolase [Nocardioides acrostichi]|uniref:Alpha/beta hydrolase n=1 Tax=Nocardioides acrostichi TaxID=2784339 RepID=A0A930UX05_9ACTN|nr:alpha/beta hydrolase [Nocardioides acrostichi]MBF4161681.1 alpha/beta hydrolase [Nocardioides acrostichi]
MTEILTVPLPDGRELEVLLGGDPRGVPLLWHGGSPSAVVPWPAFDARVAQAGLRLVTLSRPGYGASTPRPLPADRPPAYADDVPDAVAVLDHLELDRVLVGGWSGGGPRALGCAALAPDRVLAAASVAGVAPHDAGGLDWAAGMSEENVAEYATAARGAEAYEAYLEAECLPILQATESELVDAMGGLLTDVDAAALDRDGMGAWLTATFQHAGAQGVRGVRDDGLAAVAPWGFDVTGIGVPTALWQGRADAMVPFAHGEWLAAHVGRDGVPTRAHLIEPEGHLTLVTNLLPEILEDLRDLAGLD